MSKDQQEAPSSRRRGLLNAFGVISFLGILISTSLICAMVLVGSAWAFGWFGSTVADERVVLDPVTIRVTP